MDSKKVKKPHLGRGLEALLGSLSMPSTAPSAEPLHISKELKPGFPIDEVVEKSKNELDISKVFANPYQPRTTWNEQQLSELAESIRQNGILQPIIVRPAGHERFEIIAGERRFRAAQMAGLSVIPVLIRQATDKQMLELALIENIHRSDLNPIERAKAYQNYINTFNLNHTEAAQKLGEDRSVISNYLRILELPQDIKDLLTAGTLSMGHARAILALPTEQMKQSLANKAMAGRLSVREVERIVRKCIEGTNKETSEKKAKEAYIVDLEKQLQTILGTKVRIESGRRTAKGRIVIEYYSLDDFERLTERMGLRYGDNT